MKTRSSAVRLLLVGVLSWAAAAALFGTLRVVFGPRPAYINVRWAASVDDATRAALEQRYALTQGEFREGRTWGYALVDVSRDNIRTLVGDAAVEDTHQIHRTAFRVGYLAPRLPYPTPQPWIPVGLEILTIAGLLVGSVAVGMSLVERIAPHVVRGSLAAIRDTLLAPRATFVHVADVTTVALRSRIPPASAEGVALFRVAFGSAVLLFVLGRPVPAVWATNPFNAVSAAHGLVLDMFAAVPWVADWIPIWLVVWGTLFVAGIMGRVPFAMMTAGVFAWSLLYTARVTHHTVTALLVAMISLLWSHWNDAWSVDAWRGRSEHVRRTPIEYGYTVWAPAFVMGVALAAAAFAKLRDAGIAWILNGTVKYHFLSDSGHAMVDWGLVVGRFPALAVLLSFAAIAVEATVIAGVLSRRYRYRLMAGLAALSLLVGFALFQGLRWYGWWILLLGFLPWHLAVADRAAPASPPKPAPVVIMVAVLAVQVVVSVFALEVTPLLSTYDMYATTYASPAEYEQKSDFEYWLVATDESSGIHECGVNRLDAEVVRGRVQSEPGRSRASVLRTCFDPSLGVKRVVVEARRTEIDWGAWRRGKPVRQRLALVEIND